jgi:two-component system chemotaxis response regulator CheY
MHVLIVDDSKIMRQILRRALTKVGYSDLLIVEAANGLEALSQFRNSKPDLILSDWNMPEMDGMGLLQAIREEDPHIPFGFITAQSTSALRESAQYYGAHFLLSKPFTPETLNAAIQSVLL